MQAYKRKEDGVIFPWLRSNLTKNKTIIDIGARKGNWYKQIAKFFPDETAHLFEPTPNIVAKTQITFRHKNNIKLHQIALSDQEGTLDFHIDLELGGWSGLTKQRNNGKYQTIKVQVKTLDSFNFDNVGLIKIDVEGNELKTLRGAESTIKTSKPIVYFECADVHMINYDYGSRDIFKFFNALDYNVLDLDLKVLNEDELAVHTASDSSFYHNFIAMPK